jgi:hypothetical protein
MEEKMAVKKEIFADGIGQIHFAGGMVRFDFVTLQPEIANLVYYGIRRQ